MQIIVISEKHKNYTTGTVSNQLTDVGMGVCVGVGANLLRAYCGDTL